MKGGTNLSWEAKDKESDKKTTAASGLIYLGDGKTIYSAGGFVSENWVFAGIYMYATEDECPSLNKPHHVTYADGAYMVAKADAIEKTGPQGKPFIDETHLYPDDTLLSLTLWNKGYRVMYVPIRAGMHYASMTTLIMLLNIRPWLRSIYLVRRRVGYRLLCSLGVTGYCDALRALIDCLRGLRSHHS